MAGSLPSLPCAPISSPRSCFVSSLSPVAAPNPSRDGRTDPTSYERFERRSILDGDDPVQEGEGIEQHGPDILISLRCEAGGQVKIVREGHEAGDCGRPGVVDEIESFGGERVDRCRRSVPVEQIRRIAHPVESMPSFVDEH